MWEVFTCGDMPYKEKRNIDVVEYVVTQNKRLAKPASAPMIIYQIMMKCWDKVRTLYVLIYYCVGYFTLLLNDVFLFLLCTVSEDMTI